MMSSSHQRRSAFARWQRDLLTHEAIEIAQKMLIHHRFEQLLNVVHSRSGLLRLDRYSEQQNLNQFRHALKGLLAIARYGKSWVRTPETWKPAEAGLRIQFRELLRHVLCRKTVPIFMDYVWFENPGSKTDDLQTIYLHLAGGNSIRGACLPIKMSKPMAKIFMKAPDHFSYEQAIRWAHLQSLGVTPQYRDAVMRSCLGKTFEHEPVASRVIDFLSKGAELTPDSVTVVLDHLFAEGNSHQLAPFAEKPQRFPERYSKHIQQLVKIHSENERKLKQSWLPQPWAGFRYEEQQKHGRSCKYWTIEELTNSQQLIEEGKAQQHCVATYADYCQRGSSSIWSLRSHGLYTNNRELTIQVRPRTRKIVTALGRCNSRPKPEARRILELWAEKANLEIGTWV